MFFTVRVVRIGTMVATDMLDRPTGGLSVSRETIKEATACENTLAVVVMGMNQYRRSGETLEVEVMELG